MALKKEIEERIREDRRRGVENPYKFRDEDAVRRDPTRDVATLLRPTFCRDTEKILYFPLYNRYADKTQVFSFYHNDDITRRALHVQLVSRIARNIGALLGLNLDLIEAISLGHDIGHPPFGHAGERYLSKILNDETGEYFNHNVHSVRVLDTIYKRNITLQTLDGILCHNGEFECQRYEPCGKIDFSVLDKNVSDCDKFGDSANRALVPSTLEGCVVRICDIIAYLGKDRQDARVAKIIDADTVFTTEEIGTENSEIINNLIINIVENSYGRNYISMSPTVFEDLKTAKKENYEKIYRKRDVNEAYDQIIAPMFKDVYYKLLDMLIKKDENSVIYRHHIKFVENNVRGESDYLSEEPNKIVTDYMASMTDDYFVDLYSKLFPERKQAIEYRSYFSDCDFTETSQKGA